MSGPSDRGSRNLARRLSAHLTDRVSEVTEAWHERIQETRSIRPQNVFPGDALLDGMPRVVRWIGRYVENGREIDQESLESLRDLSRHWRDASFTVEESLLHFRALGGLLFDVLGEAAAEERAPADCAEVVRVAGRLCDGVAMVKVVLVAAYRDAEDRRFSDFGATLAHEIRDHVGAATSAVRFLRFLDEDPAEAPPDVDRAELLETAENALQQAEEIVTAVHALSRAESESEPERWTWVSLRAVAQDTVEEIEQLQDFQDNDVRPAVSDGLGDFDVPEAPTRLILHNLVENAVKYADPGKAERWVRIHSERDPEDGRLVVHVGDNGLGIPPDEQGRVFARFRRGENARGRGFGLGLAIASQAARKIGGHLMMESEPGVGSTFSVTLPSAAVRDPAGDDGSA